ncbi:AAA family ATPase [Micromonospora sp. NPDC048905]|uniref:ATP-binding protein n=1 Tax=Micromonospora sp. NPDC048905 TaxID=3155494 RepID=UPI0033C709F9
MTDLFGRAHEIGVLDALIAGARQGGGSVLLRGDAGVGKSALLHAATAIADRHGHLVLTAVGIDGDASPYVSLRRMLPPQMIDAADLPPAQRAALLAATRTDDPAAVPEPFLVGMAALTVLTDAPEDRPITLIVDDAHWLDAQSRAVIAFLGRRLAADPVLLIVATRPVDDPAPPSTRPRPSPCRRCPPTPRPHCSTRSPPAWTRSSAARSCTPPAATRWHWPNYPAPGPAWHPPRRPSPSATTSGPASPAATAACHRSAATSC